MNLEEGDLSLLTSPKEQDDYLKDEYGPDVLINRSKLTMNLIRIYRPGSDTLRDKPQQIAEGKFRMVTFIDMYGRVVHEVSFLESSEFLEKNKSKSWWSKLCFWRKD
tara:strand:- start:443 stop:763 length:321 start_codon:yes stop_codon:yes gene_type:complete